MQTAAIGLSIIIIGWIVQFFYVMRGRKEINASFLVLYAIGCAILAFDGFTNNLTTIGLLNMGCMITTLMVLLKISCSSCCVKT